jgi:hypothetical protein
MSCTPPRKSSAMSVHTPRLALSQPVSVATTSAVAATPERNAVRIPNQAARASGTSENAARASTASRASAR